MKSILTCSLAALILARSAFPQGSLIPPGAPAPTMKRLDEVEPRTNLQASPAPAGVDTTNANYQFVINQPGSYYLSANLAVTKTNGVQINAEGVTLDLNGFQISRAGGGGDGIQISNTAHHAKILNGSLKGFAFGTNGGDASNGARGCKFHDLAVTACTSTAILAGPGSLIESCQVYGNTGNAGFSSGLGSTLINCVATHNTVTFPISASVDSTLINCTASYNTCAFGILVDTAGSLTNCNAFLNTGTGSSSGGIMTGGSCTITACTAASNITTAATRTSSTGIGFWVGSNSTIQNCTASSNYGDGIHLTDKSLARDNNCASNGYNGDGAGIYVFSQSNRIEGNNVVGNDRGIEVNYIGNVIVRNTARANTVNYVIAANNVFGATVDRTAPASGAVSGNSAPSSAGTTDPWANISY